MLALGDLFDDLRVEGVEILGAAARDEASSTTTSSSTQLAPAFTRSVRIDGNDVTVRPPSTVGLSQQPRAVARSPRRLVLLEERLGERHGSGVGAQLVGVADAPGEHQRIEVVGGVVTDETVACSVPAGSLS